MIGCLLKLAKYQLGFFFSQIKKTTDYWGKDTVWHIFKPQQSTKVQIQLLNQSFCVRIDKGKTEDNFLEYHLDLTVRINQCKVRKHTMLTLC